MRDCRLGLHCTHIPGVTQHRHVCVSQTTHVHTHTHVMQYMQLHSVCVTSLVCGNRSNHTDTRHTHRCMVTHSATQESDRAIDTHPELTCIIFQSLMQRPFSAPVRLDLVLSPSCVNTHNLNRPHRAFLYLSHCATAHTHIRIHTHTHMLPDIMLPLLSSHSHAPLSLPFHCLHKQTLYSTSAYMHTLLHLSPA